MFEPLQQAFNDVFLTFATLQVIVFAAAYGIFIGAIPGLTATMAVALLVPITYYMEPLPALAAIVTLEACAIFAGDIPNTLLRIPGTPSSAAYTQDAYALTKLGRHQQALGEYLFHQPRPAGAQRRANQHLLAALNGAGEHEVGDVGTGDDQ